MNPVWWTVATLILASAHFWLGWRAVSRRESALSVIYGLVGSTRLPAGVLEGLLQGIAYGLFIFGSGISAGILWDRAMISIDPHPSFYITVIAAAGPASLALRISSWRLTYALSPKLLAFSSLPDLRRVGELFKDLCHLRLGSQALRLFPQRMSAAVLLHLATKQRQISAEERSFLQRLGRDLEEMKARAEADERRNGMKAGSVELPPLHVEAYSASGTSIYRLVSRFVARPPAFHTHVFAPDIEAGSETVAPNPALVCPAEALANSPLPRFAGLGRMILDLLPHASEDERRFLQAAICDPALRMARAIENGGEISPVAEESLMRAVEFVRAEQDRVARAAVRRLTEQVDISATVMQTRISERAAT